MNTLRLSRVSIWLILVSFVFAGSAQALNRPAVLPQPTSGTTGKAVVQRVGSAAPRAVSPARAATTGEILVKFADSLSFQAAAQLHSRVGGVLTGQIPALKVQVVRVPPGQLQEALEVYNRMPGVVYAEPNYRVEILGAPDDPLFSKQWNLEAIRAPEAWELSRGDGAVIAIVDTGVRPDEPDLKDKLLPGYDFVNNDPQPWDDQGHGTLIALVAAAATNNGVGIAGVGYNARIMPLKALDATGAGTHAWLAAAIVWAAERGADVINLSLGGPFSSRTLAEAVEFAWKRGVVLVAAAGNESSDVMIYPAAYPSVMAVVATTRDMQRASFSNYGRHVSIAAPGVGIPYGQAGEIWSWSGTSLATPHVAGVAALVAARNPSLTNAQIREILEQTAEDLGEPGWDPYFGHGLVNAYQAVAEAAPTEEVLKLREAMIEAVNAIRRERNLPLLRPEPRLMELAQRRAERLARQCADTVDPDQLWACLTQAATVSGGDEVALIGVETVQAAVQFLLDSPTGREGLLGAYWEIGVGLVLGNQNWHPPVWVLRFGRGRAGPVAPPPIGVLSGNKGTDTEAGRTPGEEREPGRAGVDLGDDPYRGLVEKQPDTTQPLREVDRLIPKRSVTPPAPVPPTSPGARRGPIVRGP